MSDTPKISPSLFPTEFIMQWNESAVDGLVDAAEYRAIKQLARTTASWDDDRFLSDLDYRQIGIVEAERRNEQLEAIAGAARDAGLLLRDVKVDTSNIIGYNNWVEFRRNGSIGDGSADARQDGLVGGALGYKSSKIVVGDASFGTFGGPHFDMSFSHHNFRSEPFSASLRAQADIWFSGDRVAFGIGAGPMMHFGLAGFVQFYGGVLATGMVGSVDNEGRAGWALNATTGFQFSPFYFEVDFPVVCGGTRPDISSSFGLRVGF